LKRLYPIPLMALLVAGALHAEQITSPLSHCTGGTSSDQRQRCDDEASRQVTSGSRITPLEGGWRLVRTKNPSGGADAVSVMHVADSTRSDMGLAGLNLQCGQPGVDVTLVTLEQMRKDERPKVKLAIGSSRREFEAAVQASGALLLPQSATEFAMRDWQNSAELSVEIETNKTAAIRGIIPITGFLTALKTLNANCLAR
jgi:hypothetical protein